MMGRREEGGDGDGVIHWQKKKKKYKNIQRREEGDREGRRKMQ